MRGRDARARHYAEKRSKIIEIIQQCDRDGEPRPRADALAVRFGVTVQWVRGVIREYRDSRAA